jgi:hypothetical protein
MQFPRWIDLPKVISDKADYTLHLVPVNDELLAVDATGRLIER